MIIEWVIYSKYSLPFFLRSTSFNNKKGSSGPTPVAGLGAGGSRQVIHQSFPVAATRQQELCDLLSRLVPPLDSETYTDQYPIPACFPGSFVWKPFSVRLFIFNKGLEYSICIPIIFSLKLYNQSQVKKIHSLHSSFLLPSSTWRTSEAYEALRSWMLAWSCCGNMLQMALSALVILYWCGWRTWG